MNREPGSAWRIFTHNSRVGRVASGKSPDIFGKMVEGRLRKEFYQQVVLLQQTFLAAIESQTRALKLNESLPALQERERCARQLGRIDLADADLSRIKQLEAINR